MEAHILFPKILNLCQSIKEKKISRSKRWRLLKKLKWKPLSHQVDLMTEEVKDSMKPDSAVQRSDEHHVVQDEAAMKTRMRPEYFSNQGAPLFHGDDEAAMRQRLAKSSSSPILTSDSFIVEIDIVSLRNSPSNSKKSISFGIYNLGPRLRF